MIAKMGMEGNAFQPPSNFLDAEYRPIQQRENAFRKTKYAIYRELIGFFVYTDLAKKLDRKFPKGHSKGSNKPNSEGTGKNGKEEIPPTISRSFFDKPDLSNVPTLESQLKSVAVNDTAGNIDLEKKQFIYMNVYKKQTVNHTLVPFTG